MKTALKAVLGLVLLLVLVAGAVYVWASSKDRALLARTIATHTVDFPIPFPLTQAEADELGQDSTASGTDSVGVDLASVALERAVARGEHLVNSRYVCVECHGKDFGGGVMIDDPMIGRILGPNITAGEGGRTAAFTPSDWDRIVRHGVRSDGRPTAMPSVDFQAMSDQELSDVVAYVRSQPPVDATVPPVELGPLGTVLMAVGKLPLSADLIPAHDRAHDVSPPTAEPSAEFGRHLANVCAGCHGSDLSGGPIAGGDPSWPPAANLTPHAEGLAGWTYEQFAAALRTAKRPDGTDLRPPMSQIVAYGQRMTDVEVQALWAFLQSLPARPDPK
ncbi:MAG: cytochrome c [Longimicrobiales bacterium]|nr:cytochrome c [Longimicrobiales bacterium]